MYERQHGGDMEVGSYAHRPIIVAPDDIPSNEEAVLSPTEMPFTSDDFDPQLEQALELMPELLGDERVGIRYAINGLISMTPDGHPGAGRDARGPRPVVGGGELDQGRPGHRPRGGRVDERRSRPRSTSTRPTSPASTRHQRTSAHVAARAREGFNKMYGIVHPAEQWESGRAAAAEPGLRPGARARRGVHRDGGLGAARTGTPATSRCWSGTPAG